MLLKNSLISFVIYFSCLFTAVFSTLSPEELSQLQEDHGVIYLDNENFEKILTGPRGYYLSLLFTTTAEHIPCDTCKKFDSKYKLVSQSYFSTNPGKTDLYFLVAEFTSNEEIYRKLGMSQVPKLWIFPPSAQENYNVSSPHFPYVISDSALNDPLDFASFISKIVSLNIVIQPEFEVTQFLKYFLGTFFFVLILKKKVLSKVNKASTLRYVVVFATIVLTSGYMFTVIKGIPLIAKNEEGKIMYFSGGTHWQFGLETFVVSGIYATLGGLVVGLVAYIPLIEDEKARNLFVVGFALGILYVFNHLTKIFLVKDPGYPYQVTTWL